MMERNKIKNTISDSLLALRGKDAVDELKTYFSTQPQHLDILFDLIHSADQKISWRAAWVFEHSIINDSALLNIYSPIIAEQFPTLSSDSIKRHFSKILAFSDVNQYANGAIINTCFDWIILEKTPVAVKVHCLQILYNISLQFPDLQNELLDIIESQWDNSSAGFKSRGKKIMAAIHKKRK